MWRWQSLALSSGLGKLILPEKWPWAHGLPLGPLPALIPQDSHPLHCLPSSPVHFLGASRSGSGPLIEAAPWALGATLGPCQGRRDSLGTSSLKQRGPATTAAHGEGGFKILPSHPEISVMTSHEVVPEFLLSDFLCELQTSGFPKSVIHLTIYAGNVSV